MNPALCATFDWLQGQGLPPLPVAPAQDPTRYPARDRDGSLKRDKDGTLVPAFTGKNPSFLDQSGIPHLIRHTQYQNRMPTQAELQTWFSHPANGIGTLGGWHNIVWVDVDVKQFELKEACDQRIADWLSQYPLLQQTFTERTHSGGWRLAVRVHEKSFTNFSLDGVGGQHMGEALGQGRFTVLAPTVGPSGNAYVNVQRVPPVWVERLDAIGLYPVSGRREQGRTRQSRPLIQPQPAQPGVLRLEDLATAKAQAVLHGDSPLESRSHSLTFALREFYGWENWAAQNRVPMSGNAEELARAAGAALGIDAERVERIMDSIADPASCIPAAVFAGGETSAWKRVWTLDRQAYEELCPGSIQESIRVTARENHHVLTVGKSQKWQSEVIQDSTVHQPAISGAQIQTFVRQAREILAHACQLKQGKVTGEGSAVDPKFWVQGQTYRIAAEGQ
ncbi:MAG: bifunctional DNA primase/polymerase [Leptolyngbyaceae cyanobacterium T60_A2020_046]|nr:bifunctional DNA primase/polymerase [Leptolyngbyaceae cyanobacterium T60_A2020_046]